VQRIGSQELQPRVVGLLEGTLEQRFGIERPAPRPQGPAALQQCVNARRRARRGQRRLDRIQLLQRRIELPAQTQRARDLRAQHQGVVTLGGGQRLAQALFVRSGRAKSHSASRSTAACSGVVPSTAATSTAAASFTSPSPPCRASRRR
jgi:hypothetical protein